MLSPRRSDNCGGDVSGVVDAKDSCVRERQRRRRELQEQMERMERIMELIETKKFLIGNEVLKITL